MNLSTKLVHGLLLAVYVARAMAPQAAVIPTGTSISVRTIDAIDSKHAEVNHEYSASLAEAIVIDGTEVAPRGANAFVRLEQVRGAGMVAGRASLTLRLAALTINGQRIAVETSEVTSKSGSQGAQTAKHSGLGAALGAGIGAIAGGGAGAAIGAGVGAAGGATVSAIRGQRVRVPAETQLSFTLNQPVSLAANAPPAPVSQAMAPVPPPQPMAPPQEQVQDGIRVQVQRCYRKTNDATVCEITAESLNKDMTLTLNGSGDNRPFIVDSKGMQQYIAKVTLGSNSNTNGAETFVVQNVPVRGELQFAAADPNASGLAMLNFLILSQGHEYKFVFRNIPL